MELKLSVDCIQLLGTVSDLYERTSMIAPMHGTNSTLNVEFVQWQEDDMNRKYPSLEFPSDQMAMTRIWPRSRLSKPSRFRRKTGRPVGRPKGSKTKSKLAAPMVVRKGEVVAGRRHPILRPELFRLLRERMRTMLQKVPPWR